MAGAPATLNVICSIGSPKPRDACDASESGRPLISPCRWPTGRNSESVDDRPATGSTLCTPASTRSASKLVPGVIVCAGSNGLALPPRNIGQKVTAFAPASVFQYTRAPSPWVWALATEAAERIQAARRPRTRSILINAAPWALVDGTLQHRLGGGRPGCSK